MVDPVAVNDCDPNDPNDPNGPEILRARSKERALNKKN